MILPKCLVCQTSQPKQFSIDKFSYHQCPRCGLVSTMPLPNSEQIKSHYDRKFNQGNYQLLRHYSKRYQLVYEGMAKFILRKIFNPSTRHPQAQLLDIGSFTGEFIQIMDEYNFKVTGVELQSEAVKIANQKLPGRVQYLHAGNAITL